MTTDTYRPSVGGPAENLTAYMQEGDGIADWLRGIAEANATVASDIIRQHTDGGVGAHVQNPEWAEIASEVDAISSAWMGIAERARAAAANDRARIAPGVEAASSMPVDDAITMPQVRAS